jgi:putative ABC transport system permease protein
MFSFSLSNLLSRPLRSALSTLGLTVAIAGMVGLYSIAEGLDQAVQQAFQQIPGLLVQQRGAPVPIFSTLPAAWEAELREVPGVGVVNAEILSRINLLEGKPVISPPRFLLGLDIPSRLQLQRDVYRENVVEGRFLSLADLGTLNCVVSRSIAEERRKGVGDVLNISGSDCPIVGIYDSGSMMIDVSILMDLQSVRRETRGAADTVSCFYVEADGSVPKAEVKQRIEQEFGRRAVVGTGTVGGLAENPLGSFFRTLDLLLRLTFPGSRTLPLNAAAEGTATPPSQLVRQQNSGDLQSPLPTEELSVEVRSAEDWAERFDEFSEDLNLFLLVMTTVGVVIAVLSIVNTMLMSVTERTIDLGILRANGWRTRDILQLITCESAAIGLLGGILGAICGWLVTQFVNSYWPDRMQLYASPKLLLFSIGFSVIMGVLGGLYPAWLASRLSPMEAIRRG